MFYFRSNTPNTNIYGEASSAEQTLLRLCDVHNVLLATNIATAEVVVQALERGDLDYRRFVNPNSEFNKQKRKEAELKKAQAKPVD